MDGFPLVDRAGVQAWFVYRRLDNVTLYSRVYSAIEGTLSLEKSDKFRDIFQDILQQLKTTLSCITSEQVENLRLDKHEIRSLQGKFIILTLVIRRGSDVKKILRKQEKMMDFIETNAEGRLSSQVDDPEVLKDIWFKCEELMRPFIIHFF